jgi:hypothetical protein
MAAWFRGEAGGGWGGQRGGWLLAGLAALALARRATGAGGPGGWAGPARRPGGPGDPRRSNNQHLRTWPSQEMIDLFIHIRWPVTPPGYAVYL